VHKATVARNVLKGYRPHEGYWPTEYFPAKREKAIELLSREVKVAGLVGPQGATASSLRLSTLGELIRNKIEQARGLGAPGPGSLNRGGGWAGRGKVRTQLAGEEATGAVGLPRGLGRGA